jgi:Protein of unknown function (DUF2510)
MSAPAPAWYPDPQDPARIRWWDGQAWTEHAQTRPAAAVPAVAPALPPQVVAPQAVAGSVATIAPAAAPTPAPAIPAPLPAVPMATAAPYAAEQPRVWSPTLGDPGMAAAVGVAEADLDSKAPKKSKKPKKAKKVKPAKGHVPPPATPTAPTADSAETPKRRIGVRVALAATLVLALGLAGYTAYSKGMLDSITGTTATREPSSAAVNVYQGTGYSFEAPKAWSEQATGAAGAEFGFTAPPGAVVAVSSAPVGAGLNIQSSGVRDVLFQRIRKAHPLSATSLEETGTVPFSRAGAAGEQRSFEGTSATGNSIRGVETTFVRGNRVVLATMVAPADVFAGTTLQAQYAALLSSFDFD